MGRGLIECRDLEFLIELEQQRQLSISDHLSQRRLFLGNRRKPAAHALLDRYDRHAECFGCRCRAHAFNQAATAFAIRVFQVSCVIRIEEDHSAVSPRRAASRSASRERWHSSSTSRMNSLSRNMPTTLRQSLRAWFDPFASAVSNASTRLARDSKVKSLIAASLLRAGIPPIALLRSAARALYKINRAPVSISLVRCAQ